MTDQSFYGGLFKDPTYISSDLDPKKTDPYVKGDFIPSRYLGKNMLSHKPCPGQHPSGFFDGKYLTLASADQNMEAEQILNAGKKKKSRKTLPSVKPPHISDKEFRYPSFPQQSTGPGSFYGCFQDRPFEYMTEPWVDPKAKKSRKKKKPPPEPENKHLPNVKTNPPKRGTYGVPGTLLFNPPYNDRWREEIAEMDKLEAKRNKGKAPPPKALDGPFRGPGLIHRYFDEQPGTGAPAVYNEYVAPPEKSKKKKKEAAEPKPIHDKPFQLSGARSGDGGNINPFPNVWIDPAAIEAAERKKKKKRGKKEPEDGRLKNAPEWKPNSHEKTSIISSCLRRFY